MWRGLRPREEKRWLRPCNSQPSGQVRAGRQAPRRPAPGPSHPPPAPVSMSPPYAWRMALQVQPPALASGLKAQPCAVHLQTGRLCLQSLPEKHSWHRRSMPDIQGQILLQVKSRWVGGKLEVKGWDDSEQTTPRAGQAPSRTHLSERWLSAALVSGMELMFLYLYAVQSLSLPRVLSSLESLLSRHSPILLRKACASPAR